LEFTQKRTLDGLSELVEIDSDRNAKHVFELRERLDIYVSVLALDVDAVLEKKLARPFFVRLKVVFVTDREEIEDCDEFECGKIMLFLELDGTFQCHKSYCIRKAEIIKLTWRKAPSKEREIRLVCLVK
jgi:hypothetical protein